MSKADKDSWIRHRGGKCPVEDGAKVDYRMRSGDVDSFGRKSDTLYWDHDNEGGDIMAYRLHKPAEQVEACSKPEIKVTHIDHEAGIIHAESTSSSCGNLKAGWHGVKQDGPLQWRDRITTIDFDIHSLTTERAELVQKLASEGFALIGRINELLADAAQKHEDMSDPKNWREGDIFLQTAKNIHGAADGELWTMAEDDGTTAKRYTRQNGDSWYVSDSHLCFHSRPSA